MRLPFITSSKLSFECIERHGDASNQLLKQLTTPLAFPRMNSSYRWISFSLPNYIGKPNICTQKLYTRSLSRAMQYDFLCKKAQKYCSNKENALHNISIRFQHQQLQTVQHRPPILETIVLHTEDAKSSEFVLLGVLFFRSCLCVVCNGRQISGE